MLFYNTTITIFFTVSPCILILSLLLFTQLNAQLYCSRNVKTCIKIYIKMEHFNVNFNVGFNISRTI